jgi:hypothetical protein
MAVFKKLEKGGVMAQFGGFTFRELAFESMADVPDPDEPDNPDTPDNPNPDEPDEPENPDVPDIPSTPDVPVVPVLPGKVCGTKVIVAISDLELDSELNLISATAISAVLGESERSAEVPIFK